MADYVRQAAETLLAAANRAQRVSDDTEFRGVTGLPEDLDDLARRRPGVFVAVAAAAGLAAGRALRVTRARRAQQQHGRASSKELAPTALDALSERVWPGDTRPSQRRGGPAQERRQRQTTTSGGR